jgi:hypothetical protein
LNCVYEEVKYLNLQLKTLIKPEVDQLKQNVAGLKNRKDFYF